MIQPLPDVGSYLDQILIEITKHGKNHAPIPIAVSYEDHQWKVWIDVRLTPTRSFDLEMTAPDLLTAMTSALAQLRRHMR